jgi:hypothetical protein
MKIRKGFVSNSSSSSFIVAGNPSKDLDLTITIKADVKKYADGIIKTREELYNNEEIQDFLEWNEDISICNLEEILDNGKYIYIGRFSDEEGDPIESLLCYEGISKESFNGDIIFTEKF